MQCVEAGRTNTMTEFHAETFPDICFNLLPGRVLVANPFAVRADRDDPRDGPEALDHTAQALDALFVFQFFSFGRRNIANDGEQANRVAVRPHQCGDRRFKV